MSRSLCSLASLLLRWSKSLVLHLSTRYLPGQFYVLSDLLSRRDQVIGAAWSFHPQVATALLLAWGSPSLALFATRLTAVLPLCCSLVPDPHAVFKDAFFAFLETTWACTHFHPSSHRFGGGPSQRAPNLSMTPVAPIWPEKEWFTDLLLPLLVDFLVHFHHDKGLSVSTVTGSRSALNSVFALKDLVRATSRDIFYVP